MRDEDVGVRPVRPDDPRVADPTEPVADDLVPSWILPAAAVVLAVLGGAWVGMTVRGRRGA